MNQQELARAVRAIANKMTENRDYLVRLDQQNGDGDLGISMSDGFTAVADFLEEESDQSVAKLLQRSSSVMNEAAPSSLGTILSFGFMGMAKHLKNLEEVTFADVAAALQAGLDLIMAKAGSKAGEKTILDSLIPAVEKLVSSADEPKTALREAALAAAEGSEKTKEMRSVHGRAAYYGDKSIGVLDGGSVVGRLLFEALAEEFSK